MLSTRFEGLLQSRASFAQHADDGGCKIISGVTNMTILKFIVLIVTSPMNNYKLPTVSTNFATELEHEVILANSVYFILV